MTGSAQLFSPAGRTDLASGAGSDAGTIERVAMLSVHSSPLAQPGVGDAGGMNVYIVRSAVELAEQGVAVDIFTRATSSALDPIVELAPGVRVIHVTAGPFEGLAKEDLPAQLCAFAAGVMRAMAALPEGYYDVVHTHYWLSGQVGWLVADRWQVPLVHTMHTMARVKNAHLAQGDASEPSVRELGEVQVVHSADVLVANTETEARELIEIYGARPEQVRVVYPGVDLTEFTPGERAEARTAVGIDSDASLLLFVGRIQPLKAPDLLIRALALLRQDYPAQAVGAQVVIVGGISGVSWMDLPWLQALADELGVADAVRFVDPLPPERIATWMRAADVVAVTSFNESFGLVAIEAAATGTPVIAADVGGLPLAVGPGGVLVENHDPATWARTIAQLLANPNERARLGTLAHQHAQSFGWARTAAGLLQVYRQAKEQRAANPAPLLPLLGDPGEMSR